MNFNWLKRLFIKKEKEDCINLSRIDTSLVHVRKFKDLDKESKEKVKEYYKTLDFKDYESILKFTNELDNKASDEREILFRTMTRYDNLSEEYKTSSLKQVSYEEYHLGKLASLEYRMIIDNIREIRKDLELHLIALDMFIEKENKKKYIFSLSFNKAEKMKQRNDKEKLLNAEERLLISLKNNDYILCAVLNTIKTNDKFRELYEKYKAYEKKIDKNVDDEHERSLLSYSMRRVSYKIRNCYFDEFKEAIKEEIVNKMVGHALTDDGIRILCKKFDINKDMVLITEEIANYVFEEVFKEYTGWLDFIDVVPPLFRDKMYEIIARFSQMREEYVYIHRHDDKLIIDGLDKIIKEHEQLPRGKWNKELLEKMVNEYTIKTSRIIEIYKQSRSKISSEPYDDVLPKYSLSKIEMKYFTLLYMYYQLSDKNTIANLMRKSPWNYNLPSTNDYIKELDLYIIPYLKDLVERVAKKYDAIIKVRRTSDLGRYPSQIVPYSHNSFNFDYLYLDDEEVYLRGKGSEIFNELLELLRVDYISIFEYLENNKNTKLISRGHYYQGLYLSIRPKYYDSIDVELTEKRKKYQKVI